MDEKDLWYPRSSMRQADRSAPFFGCLPAEKFPALASPLRGRGPINFADDELNPPVLRILDRAKQHVPQRAIRPYSCQQPESGSQNPSWGEEGQVAGGGGGEVEYRVVCVPSPLLTRRSVRLRSSRRSPPPKARPRARARTSGETAKQDRAATFLYQH